MEKTYLYLVEEGLWIIPFLGQSDGIIELIYQELWLKW